MARILLLDTATEVCSVALSENGRVVAYQEENSGFRHSELLTLFIGELLNDKGWLFEQLDAVSVSRGPGSYTGLRIGVSVAKGLCYGLNLPLIAVSSIDSMAHHMAQLLMERKDPDPSDILLCPMIDARRMEVFTALYNREGSPLTEVKAEIIHDDSFSEELGTGKVYFFGNGANKCREKIKHPNARFEDDIHASARFMSKIATENYHKKKFENLAYFEPFYLKDFIATIPKNKIL